MRYRLRTLLTVFALTPIALWLAVEPSAARAAPVDPVVGPFQTVLDRIGRHAATDEWRREGWADPQITAWLDKLIKPIIQAADLPALKIPVRFPDVRPADLGPLVQDGLIVGKSMKLGTIRRSIVLCDGDLEADKVEDSVVVASGCVLIGPGNQPKTAERSVIVGGNYVYIDISGKANSVADGNIVASRGWVDATETWGTAIVSPVGIWVLNSKGSTFVNADFNAAVHANQRQDNLGIRVPDLPLEPAMFHPHNPKIEFLGIVYGYKDDGGPSNERRERKLKRGGIVFRFEGRLYVAMLGQPIVDETGNAVKALHHWKLKYLLAELIAIINTAGADAVVRIQDKHK